MTSYNKSMSLLLCSLLLSSICFIESSKNSGITVDFIRRDSTRSPSYDPSITGFQRLRKASDRAFSRKSSLASLSSSSLSTDSIQAPLGPTGGEYLMTLKLGTPPVAQLLIADTGSDLLWTQCKPCESCYKQNIPLFDPSRTSTYRSISCQSAQCAAASEESSCDSNNGCLYQVAYGDNSFSGGELAADTLTFDGGVSFPKVAFGCGHNNDGTFREFGSGLVGLGGGSISIVNQLKSSFAGKFSYCLTLLDSNVSSKISFGSDAVVVGRNVVSTPLVKKSPATFYYLTLEGVSVGTERVNYISTNQELVDEGNIIIDSGTTLTFVPSELYTGVEKALKGAIRGTPVPDPQGTFKLCYRVESGSGVSSPPVIAHFTGADVVLPEMSTFVEVEAGLSCLTFLPSDSFAIFGYLHQMNYHVGYDLVSKKVSFLPTDCSKSQ